jgi:hypothetical protein
MSAGYIQLAAIGQQDAYLTGSPQITYFSGVYRRHTPFVLEAYDIPFLEQKVNYGQNNICKIPSKGDLVRGLTLKLTLPALSNPGFDWTWPTDPAPVTNQPHIRINQPASGGPNVTLSATLLVSSYSTQNTNEWLTTPFGNYIRYDAASSKFIFSNCASVEVENRNDYLAPGVFWGLDPRAPSTIAPSGNLVYTVNSTSNLQANSIALSNLQANFISTVTRAGDFTLVSAGWIRSEGILPADPKTGFFTRLVYPLSVTDLQYINLSLPNEAGGNYWEVINQTTKFSLTTGGRLKFSTPGFYAVKAGFDLGDGSMATFSYGSSTAEDTEGSAPVIPNFEYTYEFRVSPDPSMPVVIPINVTNTANTYYFYLTTTGAELLQNTYISVNQVDEIYKLENPIVMNANPCRLQLYNNVSTPSDTSVTLSPNSIINFAQEGEYLLTGVLYTNGSDYVSNVSIWQGSTLQYAYDMKLQGRDPTFPFTIPIIVTNSSLNYTMNITTTSTTTISPASYFTISRIGVATSGVPNPSVVPDNGLLFQSSSSTLKSPFNFVADFTSYGNSELISYTNSGLEFSTTGTYMVTAVVCTKDDVRSITFGPNTYDVNIGMRPPYTFHIPIVVSDLLQTYPVSVTTATVSATPNIFSNTFIAVYPITASIFNPKTLSYPYYDSVGTWAIKTAELKIGGQTIQTLTGEFIEIWNDLHVPYENQPGLQILTGKNDTGTTINPPGRTYFVNLPFYFYGNPSLYLPLVALQRHDVEVHVTFRNFSELTAIEVTDPTLDATIITEYVYLSTPEIEWFTRARLDYVITQCQYQTIGLLTGFQNAVFNLDFKNPVRELFMVIQPVNQLPYDYSNNGVQSFALSFNDQDVFTSDTTDALYAGTIEPFNHYPNFPQRKFFMYSFTGEPTSPKPNGQINFSRIKQALLTLNCSGSYLPQKELRIAAVNYNILRIANGLGGLAFNT